MKLELKHLAPYLPYSLKVINILENKKSKIYSKVDGEDFGVDDSPVEMFELNSQWVMDRIYKPILRPLSDYKDINSPAMNNLGADISTQIELVVFANQEKSLASVSYQLYEEMCRAHIDVFGLIEKGLAIDINTL